MIKVLTPKAMRSVSAEWRRVGNSVGFVPTMGALHSGHLSLVEQAKRECDRVVVSIFVNPLQFGPKEDFHRYPRPFAKDAALCRKAGVDAIFHPSVAAMYPDGRVTRIEVPGLSETLEGAIRPGHFSGVATVVAKLFSAVQPDRAYFGEKDFQQLQVIRRMTRDLDLPVEIAGCPTVREADGLALSSRNAYLTKTDRALAPRISRALAAAVAQFKGGERSPAKVRKTALNVLRGLPGAEVQYLEVRDAETLGPVKHLARGQRILAAVKLGKTRLIDNQELR